MLHQIEKLFIMKQKFIPALAIVLLIASCKQKEKEEVVFNPPVIVKDDTTKRRVENTNIEIRVEDGVGVVHATKNGVEEKIKMSDWQANKKQYEDKYGELPPPPPPLPHPPPPLPPPPPPPPPPAKS